MSAYGLSEHPEAREEFLAELNRLPPDIAEMFTNNTDAAVQDAASSPYAWPIVHYWNEQPTLRWRAVKPFRIRIVYYVAGHEVRIIAYAHEAREPGYWRARITA